MVSEPWPWWLAAVVIAAVSLLHWRMVGRLMGGSGAWISLVNLREELRAAKEEEGLADDLASLQAAMIEATLAEFGPAVVVPVEVATGDAPGETAAAPASPQGRSPWTAHLVFVGALALGGTVASLLRHGRCTQARSQEVWCSGWGGPSLVPAPPWPPCNSARGTCQRGCRCLACVRACGSMGTELNPLTGAHLRGDLLDRETRPRAGPRRTRGSTREILGLVDGSGQRRRVWWAVEVGADGPGPGPGSRRAQSSAPRTRVKGSRSRTARPEPSGKAVSPPTMVSSRHGDRAHGLRHPFQDTRGKAIRPPSPLLGHCGKGSRPPSPFPRTLPLTP